MQPESEDIRRREIGARMRELAALYLATGARKAALAWGMLEIARLREESKDSEGNKEVDVPF